MRTVIGAEPAPDSFLRAAEMLCGEPTTLRGRGHNFWYLQPVLKVDLG